MNMQAFPRDFLLKLKPDLEKIPLAVVSSSVSERTPIRSEPGFSTVSSQSADEPGGVDIIVCITLNAQNVGLVDTHRLTLQPGETRITVGDPAMPVLAL
jgi:hypothetical protein